MAGLYIHIPWCKQLCYYCDFHFRTALHDKDDVLAAEYLELSNRAVELDRVNTIYFGGGTPSLLNKNELGRFFDIIHNYYNVNPNAEITLEANPDDINPNFLRDIISLGINRLSIGIQSTDDDILRWMNRRHNAIEGINAVKMAYDIGIDNITIDLMYGLPCLSNIQWTKTLDEVLILPIKHFSAYCLTIEPKTTFGVYQKRGEFKNVDDNIIEQQFRLLLDISKTYGFKQYEISNFTKIGYESKHNTSYWNLIPYIGIGPSAHSFNGKSRRWNVALNGEYAKNVINGNQYYEEEILSLKDIYNEYIMTKLRTREGLLINDMKQRFSNFYINGFLTDIEKYIINGYVEYKDDRYFIAENKIMVSDMIISDLFKTEI